ncbi:MAG TPA: exodeoxyribonuclease V subunit gamma, partial [Spirochaetota bacterium]
MPLYLYQSNDLSLLASRFRDETGRAPLSPMEKETVLVQSIGMGRWLSLSMAESFGVWANFRYIYPNVLLDTAFRAAFDDYRPEKLVSKSEMTWQIYDVLPSLAVNKIFAPLKGYAEDESSLKRFQLAGKIADLFDQYLTSRPDMIRAWDANTNALVAGEYTRDLEDDERWQSELWRMISRKKKNEHRAYYRERLANEGFSLFAMEKLPPRLSVFGVSTLFPFHLDILEALAAHIDVRMYVLSPSSEYIADILPGKVRAKTARRLASFGKSVEDEHIARGHALIGSFGSLARDFQGVLLSREIKDMTSDDDFSS